MSLSQLFIPSKLRVGFKENSLCFNQKLAYVTYIDQKGIHRKQTSWENWRDKSIEPVDLANTPQSGFILNKDIQRYGWSHYSSGRSMIRIYDPRGVEFEITPANLLYILMNTNCYKRELEGEFVYAWDAKELVLLPVGSEEYKSSVNFTSLQSQKITSKDMKEGYVYRNKKNENLVYLGKFNWFDYSYKRNYFSEKRYIFIPEKYLNEPIVGYKLYTSTNLNNIASLLSDNHIDNYAEKLEELLKGKWCSPPVKLLTEKLTKEYINSRWSVVAYQREDNLFDIYELRKDTKWNETKRVYEEDGYYLIHRSILTFKDNKLIKTEGNRNYYFKDSSCDSNYSLMYSKRNNYTPEEILDNFEHVKIELANGLQVNYNDY